MFILRFWRCRMADDGVFAHILDSFQYPRTPNITLSAATITTSTKRRRIELQDAATRGLTERKKLKPSKAPRKRPTTITETATSRFVPSETVPLEGSRKQRRRSKKATKTSPDPPSLLSPSRARVLAESQDFLFGTSSQLATDESAESIQQTIAAITESEHFLPSQPAPFAVKRSCAGVSNAPYGTKLSSLQNDKELWYSAARDFKGEVHRDDSGLRERHPPLLSVSKYKDEGHVSVSTGSQTTSSERTWTGEKGPFSQPRPSESIPPQHSSPKLPLQPKDANPRLTTSQSPEKDSRMLGRPLYRRGIRPAEPVVIEKTFINIDDISDPEPPVTPSPPRRGASASLPPLPKLELSPDGATSRCIRSSPEALSSTAPLKREDAQWQAIQMTLFPQITATVKAAARSTDSKRPSWFQKILLYDPIVLEDFTEWLKDQHLRITVRRKKAGAKSRKKKSKAEDGMDKHADEVKHTTEVVKEELQPWMVQKWCEESGVCCLWKEGLRGGIRSRYRAS